MLAAKLQIPQKQQIQLDPKPLLFGEYLPDLPIYNNPGVTVANNVIPVKIGYEQLQDLSAVTSALDDRCRGAIAVRDNASNVYNYAGDEDELYVQSTTSMNKVSRSAGGDYTTGAAEFWEFAKWGEKVIATNFNDAPQIISLGAANFAALGGSPPKARHIAIIKNFVFMANLDESGTLTPNKCRWSAINDETDWTADEGTQSGEQELFSSSPQGGGWIMRVIGGEYGTIFQEYSIWRVTYIGSPGIFQFDEIALGLGTPSRNSVVAVGENIYFLGQNGFYVLANGSTPISIGEGKVDQTFLDDVNTARLDRVVGAADPVKQIIVWIYPSGAATTPDKCIIYDYVNQKWSTGEADANWIYSSLGVGYTLDSLDNLNSSIDALTASLDSREYTGGSLQLAAFDDAHKKATFSGAALDATIETTEGRLSSGRTYIDGVRPLVEGSGATITIQIGSRNKTTDSVSFGSASSPESSTDIAPLQSDAFYHRGRVNITGGFDHAIGLEVFATNSGGQ